MKNLIRFSVLTLLLVTTSCRTTDPDAERSAPTAVPTDSLSGSLPLGQAESEKLYLRLLAIELAAGIKVPQESLHTSWGLLVCHQDGILKSCSIHARLVGDALSEGHGADRLLTELFWSHAKASRPVLQSTKLVVADIVCDYVGPKSPPYNMEKVSCEIHHARQTHEVVIADRMAEKVVSLLRSDLPSKEVAQITLRGTVVCRSMQNAGTASCMTRGFVGDALSDEIRELDQPTSQSLFRTMLRAFSDNALLSAKGRRVQYQEPTEILGRVECRVDLSKPDLYGGHLCQIEM